jgi:hypothetical protein
LVIIQFANYSYGNVDGIILYYKIGILKRKNIAEKEGVRGLLNLRQRYRQRYFKVLGHR